MAAREQALFENSQRNRAVALASYRYGWPIDKQRQEKIALQVQGEIDGVDRKLKSQLAELRDRLANTKEQKTFFDRFNPGSSKQKGILLYEFLEEPVRVRTKQGSPSTDKGALDLIIRQGSPEAKAVATCLRDRSVFAKLQEAYINNLSDISLVRPAAHVTAQVAGRWSYRDPALQTTPPGIKPMFVAHANGWMLACDLSQAELRSMAQQSGDAAMMRAYREGRDIHKETAAEIFGVSVGDVTKRQRTIAKPLGLGYNYSVLNDENAALGLYGQIAHKAPELSVESLLGALKRLDRARPGVRKFKEQTLARAIELDYVSEPLLDRRRYFYGKVKDTEVFNFPHQAMIAAIVDKAVQGCHGDFNNRYHEGLYLQRHDELILGGQDPVRLAEMLWNHMRQTIVLEGREMLYEIEYLLTRRWGEGVAIEVIPDGFVAACRCNWGAKEKSLSTIVTKAAVHYDACRT